MESTSRRKKYLLRLSEPVVDNARPPMASGIGHSELSKRVPVKARLVVPPASSDKRSHLDKLHVSPLLGVFVQHFRYQILNAFTNHRLDGKDGFFTLDLLVKYRNGWTLEWNIAVQKCE